MSNMPLSRLLFHFFFGPPFAITYLEYQISKYDLHRKQPNWAEKEGRKRDMRYERSGAPVYVECDHKATKGNIRISAISCQFNGCFLYPRHHTCIHELIFDESRDLTLMYLEEQAC
jgi:hypothetical protein